MKENPRYQAIQEHMEEGVLTKEGYLGDDSRAIEEIIAADMAKAERLDLDIELLVSEMRRLQRKAMEGLGDPMEIDGYEVRMEEFRGTIPCPFQDGSKHAKRTVYAKHLASGENLEWTDISLHLIEKHGFFQGEGSKYRLVPSRLKEFFSGLLDETEKE